MAALTVRNIPDDVHRALRLRAAQNGRSMEAEVRTILETTVQLRTGVRMGTLLHEVSRRAGVTNADADALDATLSDRRRRSRREPLDLG